jgi:hypothetical protein
VLDERDVPMQVEVLVFEGCPHAGEAMALVREVVGRLAPGASVDRVEVDPPEIENLDPHHFSVS